MEHTDEPVAEARGHLVGPREQPAVPRHDDLRAAAADRPKDRAGDPFGPDLRRDRGNVEVVDHRRVDAAGKHGAHVHTALAKVLPQRRAERRERRLRRGVRSVVRHRLLRVERRHEHEVSGPLPLEMRQRRLDQVHRAEEVDGEGVLEVRTPELRRRLARVDAGIRDDDVESPGLGERTRDELGNRTAIGDVARHDERPTASPPDDRRGRFEPVESACGQNERVSGGGEFDRERRADAARRSGDQRDWCAGNVGHGGRRARSMLGAPMTRDPHAAKEILVIANPRAGKGAARARAERLAESLRRRGLAFRIVETTGAGHATTLARDATSAVVAIGGDGTVNECVNGLPVRAGRIGPFAVLPAGSGDDFAANAGQTRDVDELALRLAHGRTRTIDVGDARLDCEHGAVQRLFVNDAGLGFEADVVLAAGELRWLRGLPLYLTATVRAARRQRVVDCDMTYTSGSTAVTETLPVLFASACNGPRVGGGLHFAPDASVEDNALDVLRVTSSSAFATLGLLARLLRRRHGRDPRVRLERCNEVVMSPSTPLPVTLDGEVIARRTTSLRASIRGQFLSVVADIAGNGRS